MNKSFAKKMLKGGVSFSILRIVQLLTPIMALPYITRVVGIDGLGKVGFTLSLTAIVVPVIQWGFGFTSSRALAIEKSDDEKKSHITISTLLAGFLLSIVANLIFLMLFYAFSTDDVEISIILYGLLYWTAIAMLPEWYFQGTYKLKIVPILGFINSLVYLSSLFFLLEKEPSVENVLKSQAFGAVVSLCLSLAIIVKSLKISKFNISHINDIIPLIHKGCAVFLSQLAPFLYNHSSAFLLGLFLPFQTVGIYYAASKITEGFTSIAFATSKASYALLAREPDKHNFFVLIMIILGLCLTLFLFLAAPLISNFFFLNDGDRVSELIVYMSASVFLIFVSQAFGPCFLLINRLDNVYRNISVINSLMACVVLVTLIIYFGLWGAVAAIVFARFLNALVYFGYYCFHKIK